MSRLALSLRPALALFGLLLVASGCDRNISKESDNASAQASKPAVTVQLNWLHDPTFVAQYILTTSDVLEVRLREGGPNVVPLGEVLASRAQFAIVGADIFLKYLGENSAEPGKSELVCVFVDFQKNPVGWVLHPDVAKELGLTDVTRADGRQLNKWVAEQIRLDRIRVGDKRGTESTSVWLQWRDRQGLSPDTKVVPVGFDPGIVLSAPKMLYPVYLNEQPFRLSEKTRQEGKGDVIVVDPVLDGVNLYGNVIVARRDFVSKKRDVVELFQQEVRKAWEFVKTHPDQGAKEVAARYTGVASDTVAAQVARTLDLVYTDGVVPGHMDESKNGMWVTTLRALQEAGCVNGSLRAEQVLDALVPPK